MLAELVVASIAVIVWAHTSAGYINSQAHTIVFYATLATALFNANPLLRFDGYYILSDLLRMPNLYQRGGHAWSKIWGRLLLGIRTPGKVAPFLAVYGAACMVWRCLILATICLAAVALFHGVGAVLAVLTLVASFTPVVKRTRKAIAGLEQSGDWPRVRLRAVLSCLLVLGLTSIPLARNASFPGVVRMADEQEVRVDCPGFVREVHVTDGDWVEAGQLLVVLENPEALQRLRQLRLNLQEARLLAQRQQAAGDLYMKASTSQRIAQLSEEVAEVASYVDSLDIRAERSGRVALGRLQDRIGSYVETGFNLMQIGEVQGWHTLVAIPESQAEQVAVRDGEVVSLLLVGRSHQVRGEILSMTADANARIIYPELTALGSGPLDVLNVNSGERQQSYGQMVEPCFYMTVRIADDLDLDYRSGERAYARIGVGVKRPLFVHVYHYLANWVDSVLLA